MAVLRAVLTAYVRGVDRLNLVIGRIAMYSIFLLMGILLFSSYAKVFSVPALWTLEMAQFVMVAYYLLGGGYSLQSGSHVRMDLLYGRWSDRTRTWVDAFTVLFLIFYLGVLLQGGIASTAYALEYAERAHSAWRPYMAPIKIVMCVGVFLILLQAIAMLIRDVARLRGEAIE